MISLYDKIDFVFLYILVPFALTTVYVLESNKSKDKGMFDILFSVFLVYLVLALVYNYWTGEGLRYMVGLTAAMAVKEAVLTFDKGNKKHREYNLNKSKKY